MGTQAVDIMQQSASSGFSNTPAALRDMSPVERFFFSLFSETHSGFETGPHLKVPFTVSVSEIRTVGGVDVRLGGFGPFFSGAILLAAVCTVMIWFRSPKQNNVTLGLLLIAFAMSRKSLWERPSVALNVTITSTTHTRRKISIRSERSLPTCKSRANTTRDRDHRKCPS